jgi:hypothetical protein
VQRGSLEGTLGCCYEGRSLLDGAIYGVYEVESQRGRGGLRGAVQSAQPGAHMAIMPWPCANLSHARHNPSWSFLPRRSVGSMGGVMGDDLVTNNNTNTNTNNNTNNNINPNPNPNTHTHTRRTMPGYPGNKPCPKYCLLMPFSYPNTVFYTECRPLQ